MRYLGLELSSAFVRSPECDGVNDRFYRTPQEQVIDFHVFKNCEEAKATIIPFIQD